MAQLSYRYVEQTTQHLAFKKRFIYGGFAAIVAGVAGLGYLSTQRVEATIQSAVSEMRSLVLDDSNECIGAKSVFNNCEESFGHIEDRFSQITSNDSYDYILSQKVACPGGNGRLRDLSGGDFCVVGDKKSKREITIWGDSHAQHWINPMDKIGIENNIKVNIIGTSNCFGSDRYKERCDARFNSIKQNNVLDRSESIIISMWHSNRLNEIRGNNIRNSIEILNNLTRNDNLYLLEDTPFSGPDGGPNCNILKQTCKNNLKDAVAHVTKDSNDIVNLGMIPEENIITTKDIFCDNQHCYSNIGGFQVYQDRIVNNTSPNQNSHMTASFAYSTWPMLEQKLKDAGIL